MAITKEFESEQVTPIQVRGFSFQESRPFPEEHAMISLWRNINQYAKSQRLNSLLAHLDEFGLRYRFVNGDMVTAPYYVSTNQQLDYLNFLQLDEFITVWISPLVRDSFKATEAIKVEEQHARLLQLPIHRRDIRTFKVQNNTSLQIPDATVQALQNYAHSRNIQNLYLANNANPGLSLHYLLDSSTLQQFILLLDETDSPVAAINLNSLNNKVTTANRDGAVEKFVQARHLWLLPEGWKQ